MTTERRAEIENDPSGVFALAESFHNAAFCLMHAGREGPEPFPFPVTTCFAFSLELYLKCLATINTGKTPRGHDLVRLFEKVASAQQARIRTLYGIYLQDPRELKFQLELKRKMEGEGFTIGFPDPLDFDAMLGAGRRAFEVLRYGYEPPDLKHPPPTMSGQIVRATRNTILEMYPDWHGIPYIRERLD